MSAEKQACQSGNDPLPANFSLFDESCRRKGLDPRIERVKHDALIERQRRAEEAHLRWRAEKEEQRSTNLGDVLGQLAAALQRPGGPDCLAGIQTKTQLKEFLMELLFDDIVAVAQGVLEGSNNDNSMERSSEESGRENDVQQPPKKG